jgi:uncharacterized membrane protein YagU involved in acid resistance
MTPLTKIQWKSVLLNTVFAFVASFLPVLLASENLDKAALVGAATAGVMAALKVVEKALKTE